MNLRDYKELVSFLAVVFTIIQFLAGIPVCKKYVVNRTTADTSPLPFICGFTSSSIWLLYGLIKQDNIVILVNVVGVLLMISYTLVYYKYTFKKSRLLKQLLVSVGILLTATVYNNVETDYELLLNRMGLSACLLTLFTIASPMSMLLYVIKTKCTECLPFLLILMTFVVSCLWAFYGIIEQDIYMTVPNFIGGALAAVQLSFFLIYPSTPYSSFTSKTTLA